MPRRSINWWERTETFGLSLVLVCLAAVLVAGEFGKLHWWLDQFSHFRGQVGLAAVFVAGWLALRHRWRLFSGAVLLVFVAIWLTFPGVPVRPPPVEGHAVRLMSFNAYARNDDLPSIGDLIAAESPDVILLFEVTARFDGLLTSLAAEYPYRRDRRFGAGGSTILSRLPFAEDGPGYAGASANSVTVRLPDGASFDLFAVHFFSPITEWQWQWRNGGMDTLAALLATRSGPLVVAGDFNCTPYSPFLREFLDTSGLAPPSRYALPRATWVSDLPWVGLPIDHVFLSPEVVAERAWTGPAAGSDHYPIFADLIIPPSPR